MSQLLLPQLILASWRLFRCCLQVLLLAATAGKALSASQLSYPTQTVAMKKKKSKSC